MADVIQPVEARQLQFELLSLAGHDTDLKIFTADDVDGQLVKTLEHGMNASMRALFDFYYPTLRSAPGRLDTELGTDTAYLCGGMIYSFGHGQWGCKMHIEHLNLPRRSYRPPAGNWGGNNWTAGRD